MAMGARGLFPLPPPSPDFKAMIKKSQTILLLVTCSLIFFLIVYMPLYYVFDLKKKFIFVLSMSNLNCDKALYNNFIAYPSQR